MCQSFPPLRTALRSFALPLGLLAAVALSAPAAVAQAVLVPPVQVASAPAAGTYAGAAADAQGNLYLPAGTQVLRNGSPFVVGLVKAVSVALDPAGNLWVADNGAGAVVEFSPAQVRTASFPLAGVLGVAAGPGGAVAAFNQSTAFRLSAGSFAPLPGAYARLEAVAYGPNADIYVADKTLNRIFRYAAASSYAASTVFAGTGTAPAGSGDGGPAFQAGTSSPTGLAVDAAGNVYDLESGAAGPIVRRIDPTGTIQTIAGQPLVSNLYGIQSANFAALSVPGPASEVTLTLPVSLASKNPISSLVHPAVDGLTMDALGRLLIPRADGSVLAIPTQATFAAATVGSAAPEIAWFLQNPTFPSGNPNPITITAITPAPGEFSWPGAAGSLLGNTGCQIGGSVISLAGQSPAPNGFCEFDLNATPAAAGVQTGSTVLSFTNAASLPLPEFSTGLAPLPAARPMALAATQPLTTPASSAELAVAKDPWGNLYVSQLGQGVFLVAGGNATPVPATSALFAANPGNSGNGMAFDAAGDLFFTFNQFVYEAPVTSVSGNVPSFGAPVPIYASLDGANTRALAFDSAGDLYVGTATAVEETSLVNSAWRTGIVIAGTHLAGFSGDGGPATSAQVNNVAGLAMDAAGNLYLADTNNFRVRRVQSGVISTLATASTFLTGLALDPGGNLYFDAADGTISALDAPGGSAPLGPYPVAGAGTASAGAIGSPRGIAVDAAGNLFVLNSLGTVNAIAEFTPPNGTAAFGTVNVGSSATQLVSIANLGTSAFTISGGSPAGDFTIGFSPAAGATCVADGATAVAPGTSCLALVTFTPTTGGTRAGSLAVNTSAGALAVFATGTGHSNSPTPASLAAIAGTPQSATVATAYATALVAKVTDSGNNPIAGIAVTFTAPASGASGTFAGNLTSATVTSDGNGLATSPAFTANTVAGGFTVTAAIASPNLAATFLLTNNAGAPASLTLVSGGGQSTAVGTTFAAPLVYAVKDSFGNPVSGAVISVGFPSNPALASVVPFHLSITTGNDGTASTGTLTANDITGQYTAAGVLNQLQALTSLNNAAGAPAAINVVSGSNQSAAVATAFAAPVVYQVVDKFNNAVPGVTVNFLMPAAGAGATGQPTSATTGANGEVSTGTLTANHVAGQFFTAAVSGSLQGTATLTNTAGAPAALNVVSGNNQSAPVGTNFAAPVVFQLVDSFNNPIAGATVTFPFLAGGPNVTSLPASAVTDANGQVSTGTLTANHVAGANYTVSAQAGSLRNFALLTNLPGPPADVLVSLPPTVVAGQSVTALAQVTDSFNNLVPGATLTFASSDAAASFPASAPEGNLAVVFNTGGAQTLTATSGAISGSAATTVLVTSVSFPATPVGSPDPAQPITLGFPSAATVGSIQVVTQGFSGLDFTNAGAGTCAVGAQAAGSTCTVNVQFQPTAVGRRLGALVVYDTNNHVLQTIYLSGIGQGALAAYQGAAAVVHPAAPASGFALDSLGNVYVPTAGNGLEVLQHGTFALTATGLSTPNPNDAVMDGAGNLYISLVLNQQVLRVPNVNGVLQYSQFQTIGGSGQNMQFLAVDPAGNVFVATGNGGLFKIAPGSLSPQLVNVALPGNTQGLAFGNDGNLYLTSFQTGNIYEVVSPESANPTLRTVASPGGNPMGMGFDPAGDLYYNDSSTGKLYRVSNAGGTLDFASPTLLATVPHGYKLAFDAAGSMYEIMDNGGLTVTALAAPPAQAYPQTNVGSSSAAQSQALTNIGNLPLTFGAVTYDASFPNQSSTCGTGTLATAASCAFTTAFAPQVGGPVSGTLSINDNAVNETAAQTIAQSGTGAQQPQTITFNNPGNQTYNGGTISLGATASSGLAVSYNIGGASTGAGTIAGGVLTVTFPGSFIITASQAGNAAFAAATPVVRTFTVSPAPLTLTGLAAQNKLFDGTTAAQLSIGTLTLQGVLGTDQVGVTTPTSAAFAQAGVGQNIPVTATPLTLTGSKAAFYVLLNPGLAANISPATPTVTWNPNPTAVTFGAPLPAGTLDATANVPGTFAYTIAGNPVNTSSVLNAGAYTILATFTPTDATDYNGATAQIGFAVNPAPTTVTFPANPVNVAAGTALAAIENAAGSVPGTITYALDGASPATVNGGGDHLLVATLTPASANYLPSSATLLVEVPAAAGPTPVGTPSPLPVSLDFPSGVTVGKISVVTEGFSGLDFTDLGTGTCATGAQAAGSNCTLNLQFKPTAVGQRLGAVIVSDTNNHVLQTIYLSGLGQAPQGVFSSGTNSVAFTIGDGGQNSLTFDAAGNLYYSDLSTGEIRKQPPTGAFTTVASGFGTTAGVAIDGAGNLYFASFSGNAVYRIAAGTTVPVSIATVPGPEGLAVDGAGDLFIAASGSQSVEEIAVGGGISQMATGLNHPLGIVLDGAGNLFVSDRNGTTVVKIAPGGALTTVATGLSMPLGLALDAAGNLYITNAGTNQVLRVAAGTQAVTTAVAGLNVPKYVGLDPSGNLYVANAGAGDIIKVDRSSAALAFPATNVAGVSQPQTAAFENDGNLTLAIATAAASANFQPDATSTCVAGNLAAGATCQVAVDFAPTAAGTLSGTFTLTDNSLNHAGATQVVSLSGTANQVAQSISFTLASPVTFGVAPITLSASATSNLAVTFSVVSGPGSITGNTLTVNGAGTIIVQADQAGNAEFSRAPAVQHTLGVQKATPTITWNPSTLTTVYGTPITAGTLDATGSVPGTIAYTINGQPLTAGTNLPAGTYTVTATFTPSDTTDYTGQTATITFTVTKASLTVKADSFSRAFNTANPTFTGTITGAVNGDAFTEIFSTAATPASPVVAGGYAIVPAANGAALSNYTVTVVNGTLTVTQATPTITWTPSVTSVVYGNPITSATLDAAGSVPGTITYSVPAGTNLAAGTYTVTATFTPTDATDYTGQTAQITFTVTPAPLTVKADSFSRAFNTANPAFTGTITGAVNGDVFTETFSTAATPASPVVAGGYAIVPAANGAALSNYTVTVVNGTLTVTQATPTITWTPSVTSVVYGNPITSATLDATGSVPGTITYSVPAGTNLAAGTYTVTATFTPTDATDYTGQTATITFTVTPANLTVVAANFSRFYNTPNPVFTGTVTGVANGDSITVTYSTHANMISPVVLGGYPITPAVAGAALVNYNVTLTPGTLTINPAPQSITFPTIGDQIYNGTPVTVALNAVASSGLPVAYAVTGPATLAGATLTLTGQGAVTVTAAQPGSSNYLPAASVAQTFQSQVGLGFGFYATAAVCRSLVLNGNLRVDSFDSSLGAFPAGLLQSGGNVGTNGTLTLNGNSIVYGALFDPHGNTRDGDCDSGHPASLVLHGRNAQVTGGITGLPAALVFPTPAAPAVAPPTTALRIGPSRTPVNLAPGTYGNLEVAGNVTVNLAAGTYNLNSLRLDGGATLNIASGPVTINLAGQGIHDDALDAKSGAIVNPLGPKALVILYGGRYDVELAGGHGGGDSDHDRDDAPASGLQAVVYAPNARVKLSGGTVFSGTIVGYTITGDGDVTVHYDRSLASLAAFGGGTPPPPCGAGDRDDANACSGDSH